MSKSPNSQQDLEKELRELRARVLMLEAEVKARESDLAVFRKQLATANLKLESLVDGVSNELKVAAQIQKILVPTEFPNIPGFEFSTKFVASPISGGDYFDIFEHEDRMKFGLVLASSNGYGMSALLLSVLLKMTGNHEAKRGLSPDKVIQFLARELEPSLGVGPKGNDRANILYGVIDRRTLEFSYASAGPLYGGILRASTGKLERLVGGDSPIEKGSHVKLGALKKVNLEARDRLFVVSGGALVARNASGETFGEEKLIRTVLAGSKAGTGESVHDLRNEILYQIESHLAGEDLPQDVTVVAMEVRDRVIRLAPRK